MNKVSGCNSTQEQKLIKKLGYIHNETERISITYNRINIIYNKQNKMGPNDNIKTDNIFDKRYKNGHYSALFGNKCEHTRNDYRIKS